jgi:Xaa-Pro aminopeptidase
LPHRLDELLDELSAQALLVVARTSRDPYLASFTGAVKLGPAFVVAPRGAGVRLGYLNPMDRDGAAATGLGLLTPEALDVVRWARETESASERLAHVLSRAFHLCEMAPGRIALAGWWSAGEALEACARLGREGWSFAGGERLVLLLRRTKSAGELAEMRRVAAGTMAAFHRVAELLAAAEAIAGELWLGGERLRVARLTREIARALAEHQLEQPEGGICAPGREGTVPHTGGTPERVLRPHESLVVDLYPCGRLFVDASRTFCVGTPPEALARAHAHVREALELARRGAAPGRRGWSLQEAVCEHLGGAGYPTPIADHTTTRGYVHGLGHGVGLSVHEIPYFKKEHTGPEAYLEEGDVFTLEPGLYEPDAGWAVRLEDTYWLGPEGPESLLPMSYEMDPRAWGAMIGGA